MVFVRACDVVGASDGSIMESLMAQDGQGDAFGGGGVESQAQNLADMGFPLHFATVMR